MFLMRWRCRGSKELPRRSKELPRASKKDFETSRTPILYIQTPDHPCERRPVLFKWIRRSSEVSGLHNLLVMQEWAKENWEYTFRKQNLYFSDVDLPYEQPAGLSVLTQCCFK